MVTNRLHAKNEIIQTHYLQSRSSGRTSREKNEEFEVQLLFAVHVPPGKVFCQQRLQKKFQAVERLAQGR